MEYTVFGRKVVKQLKQVLEDRVCPKHFHAQSHVPQVVDMSGCLWSHDKTV